MAGSFKKTKGNKVILDRTAYFLGRFLTKDVNDSAIDKLRSIIRLDKGYKTKLRVGVEGVSTGHKHTSGLLKNKLPYEFLPLEDIVSMKQDTKYTNVVLIVVRLTTGQSEILAFRIKESKVAAEFVECFSYITSGDITACHSYSSPFVWPYTPGNQTENGILNYQRSGSTRSLPNGLIKAGNSQSDDRKKTETNGVKLHGRLYRRDGSPAFDGSVYHRSGSYRWNSHAYSRHHRRTFRPSDITSTNAIVQWVRDFQVQVHLNPTIPINVKEGVAFAVKSYSNVVKMYIHKGIAVADVSCQTRTATVVSKQDIKPTAVLQAEMSLSSSNNGSVRSSSLSSESFRKQVHELTQEVRELKQLLQERETDEQNVKPLKNNTNAHGHQSASDTDTSASSSSTLTKNKTAQKVAWSSEVEQFDYGEDAEGPDKTSTPRNNGLNLQQANTGRIYFLKTGPVPVPANEDESRYVNHTGWENGVVYDDVQPCVLSADDRPRSAATIAVTNSRYNRRPSILNLFRTRSRSPAPSPGHKAAESDCVYKTQINIRTGRASKKDRGRSKHDRRCSSATSVRNDQASLLYVGSERQINGFANTPNVSRPVQSMYLPNNHRKSTIPTNEHDFAGDIMY